MDIGKVVEKLIKLSPSIRVVTVCDLNGKVVFSAHARRVRIALTRKESRESLKSAARAWKVRKALVRRLGKCKYVLAEYETVKRITAPAGHNHIFFVSTTVAYDHKKVVRKIHSFR